MKRGCVAAPTTNLNLVNLIREGADSKAWASFVTIYGPFIFHMCRQCGLNDAEASDTTQNVFIKVWRSISRFDHALESGTFRGWLSVLTRNEIASTWKWLNRAGRGPGGTRARDGLDALIVRWEDGGWEEEFAAHIHRTALARIRAHCTKRTWTIFKRTWIDGCPAARVAQAMGLSVDRVFEAKCRVLKRFREEVARLAEESAAMVPLKDIWAHSPEQC